MNNETPWLPRTLWTLRAVKLHLCLERCVGALSIYSASEDPGEATLVLSISRSKSQSVEIKHCGRSIPYLRGLESSLTEAARV